MAEGRGPRRRLRARLAVVLPLLALLVFFTVPTVFAGGGGVGVSVSPGSGPVGTYVTLTGNGFPVGDNVSIAYTTGTSCGSGVITITGATATVGSNKIVTIRFQWPATAQGAYTICAIDNTGSHTASTQFTVVSANPPAITVSGPVTSGQQVTVNGSNYLPGGGTVDISSGGAAG
ncbi:MAG TPA: IPT/TIG domain-containing protein, partial [Ktedonobacterales bacterium]|nr:IPT/TIG domain-containing protein [Ktedonobacterales bacterium]